MWFKIKNQHVEIHIFAKPNAKRTALVKINDNGLHISLHAKPHEGEANRELISYLTKLFQIPKSHLVLERGLGSRYKVVLVPLTTKVREFLKSPNIK